MQTILLNNDGMTLLSKDAMASIDCGGAAGCIFGIVSYAGAIAALAAGPVGWSLAAECILYLGSGLQVGVECGEWMAGK